MESKSLNQSGHPSDQQTVDNTDTAPENQDPVYTNDDLFRVLYAVFFADVVLSRRSKALQYLDAEQREREENPWVAQEASLVAAYVMPFRSLDSYDFALMTVIVRSLSEGANIKYMPKYWERAEKLRPKMSVGQQALFDELKNECFSE